MSDNDRKKVKKINKDIINKEIDNNLNDGIEIVSKHSKVSEEKRQQRIGKTFNETLEEYEEVLNRKTTYEKIRPFVIVIFIILLIIGIYTFFMYVPIIGISLNKNIGITDENKIDIVTTEEDIYEMYNNELLIYSNKSVTTYNSNADKTWEYSLVEQFTPKLYIEGKYMAIVNNIGGTIYLFDNKQEILNKKLDGTISNVYLDNRGNFAVEYSTSGYKKIIGVYSKSGKNLYNAYLSSNALIDVKIIDNGNKLVVIQSSSSSFKIGFYVYLIDGKVASDNVNEIAKFTDNSLYNLTIQNQNIIILTDDGIKKVNMNSGEKSDIKDFTSSQVMFVSLEKSHYTTIEKDVNTKEDIYVIKNNRFDNTDIGSLNLENSPKIMKSFGLVTYLVYQEKILVVNKWGMQIKDVQIDFPPRDIIIFNNGKSSALIYTNKVYIVNI